MKDLAFVLGAAGLEIVHSGCSVPAIATRLPASAAGPLAMTLAVGSVGSQAFVAAASAELAAEVASLPDCSPLECC